jgi:hypothetical protein
MLLIAPTYNNAWQLKKAKQKAAKAGVLFVGTISCRYCGALTDLWHAVLKIVTRPDPYIDLNHDQ